MYDVIIVGGGASGIVAALTAAERGKSVLILECADRLGKKILSTGNGKCNLTNRSLSPDKYNAPSFVAPTLAKFGYRDCVEYFLSLGLLTVNEDGREYPYSRQASSVVNALLYALARSGADIAAGAAVNSVRKENGSFAVTTGRGKSYLSRKVILATGSNATSGRLSYDIAPSLETVTPRPSLTYMRCGREAVKGLSGIRLPARATLVLPDGSVTREGELLFKESAVSGIMIFELSCFLSRARREKARLILDLMPDKTYEEIKALLDGMTGDTESKLRGIFHKNLAALIAALGGDTASNIKSYAIDITGVGDIGHSQTVCGGFSTDGFDPETLESLTVGGLYATGEVLDVDGECGGYNLHWAWASGRVAGGNV